VKREEGNTNSPELSLLKFLLLTYHHSDFLTATLDFTSFFTMAFLGAAHFFYSWAVFGLDISIQYCFRKIQHYLENTGLNGKYSTDMIMCMAFLNCSQNDATCSFYDQT